MTALIIAKIENKHTELFLRSDGIVQLNTTEHTYSIADILENEKALGQLTNQQKMPILVIANEFSMLDAEARTFLTTKEAMKYSSAEAYVIGSLSQRIVSNFMAQTNEFPVPVKFFKDESSAVEWLKTFK
jgi:hypothetical protein